MEPGYLELLKIFGPMAGFGVLMWILLREQLKSHAARMEQKDKDHGQQFKELLAESHAERALLIQRYDAERDNERKARHERANQFQLAMGNMGAGYEKAIKDLQAQHRLDAEQDRAAFLVRNNELREAIRTQTVELKLAFTEMVKGICQAARMPTFDKDRKSRPLEERP